MIAKFLSALICGSLILTSPGLGSYQSLAGGLRKAPAGKAAAVGVSPVLPPLLVFGRVQFPRLIQVDGGFVRPYNIVDDQIRYERIGLEEAQGLLEQGVEAVSFASPELLVKEKEALRVWVAQGQKTARQELEGVEAHLRQEGYGGILDMVASQGGTPQNSDRFAQLSAVAFDLNQREERPVYPQEVAPIQAGPQRRVEPSLPDRSRVPQAG
ncbi:MAG: hypothetical protein HY402_04315, partial [Elusimicrobia bacterium]|nr:hypothetical protein [Elusimicrobiota bacterium]